MPWAAISVLSAVALLLVVYAAMAVGHRIGTRRLAAAGDQARAGTGTVDGAVLALLGLMIAFTFTSAAGRYERRRELITQECNALGTAWLRVDLLAERDQAALRQLLARYVATRIDVHRSLPDLDAAKEEFAESGRLQEQIWDLAVAAAAREPARPAPTILLLPALNQAFDLSTTRVMAVLTHVPELVVVLLCGLSVFSGLLAGHALATRGGTRNRLHAAIFAFAISLSIYVTLDLEFPRIGLINLDKADRPLLELKRTFDAAVANAPAMRPAGG